MAKICVNCGAKMPDDMLFCTQCGKKLEDRSTLRMCPRCGENVGPDDLFCIKCGKPLSDPSPDAYNEAEKSADIPDPVVYTAGPEPEQELPVEPAAEYSVTEIGEDPDLEDESYLGFYEDTISSADRPFSRKSLKAYEYMASEEQEPEWDDTSTDEPGPEAEPVKETDSEAVTSSDTAEEQEDDSPKSGSSNDAAAPFVDDSPEAHRERILNILGKNTEEDGKSEMLGSGFFSAGDL